MGKLKLFGNSNSFEIIWVGDSTSDKRRIKFIIETPTAELYREFKKNFLKKKTLLHGAKNTVFAKSGATTQEFLDNSIRNANFRGIDDIIKYCKKNKNNKIIVYSLGHNDGITIDNWEKSVLPKHKKMINRILQETNAFIILRMPNAWVSVEGGATKEQAHEKTVSLYRLYLKLNSIYINDCLMINIQDLLNWKDNDESKKFMADWTHPNKNGYAAIANVVGNAILDVIKKKRII